MKMLSKILLLAAAVIAPLTIGGCARPNEFGWTPAYTGRERGDQIARNWDMEGKQIVDDFDHAMLLRPMGRLSVWNLR